MSAPGPVYLGSQTLVEREGKYYMEHRNADDELTRTETVGNLLDLNLRLLGLAPTVGQSAEQQARDLVYVECICLWHTEYPDERMVGRPNCPAHPGDDRDESQYDRDE